MIDLQQPFVTFIESILLKICIHYLFYTPNIVLDMLEAYAISGMGMLKPLFSVKKIQVYIGINIEDLTYKCKIHTVGKSKRTREYIGNTEPIYFWYNYVIVNNIPEVHKDNFTLLIQDIIANIYQVEVLSRHNRYEKKKWLPIYSKVHSYFTLTEKPIILVKTMV